MARKRVMRRPSPIRAKKRAAADLTTMGVLVHFDFIQMKASIAQIG
jgi:hypothetical protein